MLKKRACDWIVSFDRSQQIEKKEKKPSIGRSI